VSSLIAREGHRSQASETVHFSEFVMGMNTQSSANASRSKESTKVSFTHEDSTTNLILVGQEPS